MRSRFSGSAVLVVTLLVVGAGCSSSDDQAARFEGSAGPDIHWTAIAKDDCVKVTTDNGAGERGTCELDPSPLEHAEWNLGPGQIVVGAVDDGHTVLINGTRIKTKSGYFATFINGHEPLDITTK